MINLPSKKEQTVKRRLFAVLEFNFNIFVEKEYYDRNIISNKSRQKNSLE